MSARPVPCTRFDVRARTRPGYPSLVAALLVASVLVATPRAALSGETIVTLEPFEPLNSVWMLSAPHVGRRTCEIEGSTRARFIDRVNHGPHPYADIEVLEGACAGRRGYVPWSNIEPKPETNRYP